MDISQQLRRWVRPIHGQPGRRSVGAVGVLTALCNRGIDNCQMTSAS